LNTFTQNFRGWYSGGIARSPLAAGLLSLLLAGCTLARVQRDAPPADPGIVTDDALLEEYVREFGPAAALREAKLLSPTARVCHNLAHKIGRFSYDTFGDRYFTLSLPDCQSGVTHGMLERFLSQNGTGDLNESLSRLCPHENAFERSQCFHGIGHGLMGWWDYALPEALASCDSLSNTSARSPCRSGVFMENRLGFLAGESGHSTAYLSDDPQYPCTIVQEHQKPECYFGQADHMMRLFGGDFAKVSAACARSPRAYRELCFAGMGRTVIAYVDRDAAKSIAACSVSPDETDAAACLKGAVQDTFWTPDEQEEGFAFCAEDMAAHLRVACYAMLSERAAQLLSRSAFKAYCGKFPQDLRDECLLPPSDPLPVIPSD
jgi:hypothetical protein